MSVTANRTTTIELTGDVTASQTARAAENAASPGSVPVQALANGFNSVAVPVSTGITVTAVTIIPPTGNTTSITLKGLTGDTGLRLHDTDPTTIAIHSSVSAIGLTAGAAIQGVRFIWT